MRKDREDPSLDESQLGELQFRRPGRVPVAADDHRFAGLWWRIALGVFVGALAHSAVVGLYVRWELQRAISVAEADMKQAEREMARALDQSSSTPRSSSVRPARPAIRPLAAGERCVGGKRFRRIENGWVQMADACR